MTIHRTFAGSLERGEKNVSFHALVLISRCLGVTLSELFEGLEQRVATMTAKAGIAEAAAKSSRQITAKTESELYKAEATIAALRRERQSLERTLVALRRVRRPAKKRPNARQKK